MLAPLLRLATIQGTLLLNIAISNWYSVVILSAMSGCYTLLVPS
jgi:hypothetical protein